LIAVGKEQLPKNTNNLVENDFTLEPIRRGEGVWTTHEVENVARLMLDERDFREIPYAGSLILKNTKGEKSFSEDHRLFVDSPLHIETGPLSNINEDWGKIGATNIREPDLLLDSFRIECLHKNRKIKLGFNFEGL